MRFVTGVRNGLLRPRRRAPIQESPPPHPKWTKRRLSGAASFLARDDEGPASAGPSYPAEPEGSLHHPAHVGHTAAHSGAGLLGRLGDDRLGGEDVLRDRRSVLKRRA